ncbi:Synaptosomal-associated protein 29 [Papilio xuthus]|uniref:Synaptosomal-associated protein 29 n=1 Tax=Papilio xuthus TaxID=66420 RepID=A0A0N1IQC3_PAPXU|nr:Synaptosomal-associated protein 29 [Papilio xuthus]
MSDHRYINNSSNLFEDDDVDNDTFVQSYRSKLPQPPRNPVNTPYGGHIAELEKQRQAMLQRQKEIEQRTLDSSIRSIGLLHDSETIGIATVEELARQREQLQNTNRRLDEINTNLHYSQKHLNGIKSVFYGLKNYISGKSDQTPPRSQASPDSLNSKAGTSSKLDEPLDNTPKLSAEDRFNSHPSTRLRGLNQEQASAPISDSQRINEMLDANLDEMVQHITRLKGLGSALGEEIDSQNKLIDTIQDKVEVADVKIGKQNKQLNKILGK